MSKLKVKLVKSPIDRPENQKRTLKALGLTKLHKTIEVESSAQMKGMLASVKHMLSIEEAN